MTHVKIEGKTLERDIGNRALLETDTRTRDDYITKKKLLIENRKMKTELSDIRAELDEIKRLIKEK